MCYFRYDLLPFYARFVASLNPCVPSIAADLAFMLKTDFRNHASIISFNIYTDILSIYYE